MFTILTTAKLRADAHRDLLQTQPDEGHRPGPLALPRLPRMLQYQHLDVGEGDGPAGGEGVAYAGGRWTMAAGTVRSVWCCGSNVVICCSDGGILTRL